ncbi:hypothetical protein STEG23_018861, partial [Scotinomys teguina]
PGFLDEKKEFRSVVTGMASTDSCVLRFAMSSHTLSVCVFCKGDPKSVLRTYNRFTIACNSSGFDALFWSLAELHSCAHTVPPYS